MTGIDEPGDDEMTGFVQALAERVPGSDAPVPRVLAAAREAARRRSRRRGAGLMAAVAAAVLAVAVTPALVGGGPVHDLPVVGPSQALPSGSPPRTKLVGADGVAMAVPEAWTQERPSCGHPDHPYYYLVEPVPEIFNCPNLTDSIVVAEPSLAIDTSPTRPPASPVRCSTGSCTQTWVRPGVSFTATAVGSRDAADEQLTSLGDSLTEVADGYVAIPLWPRVQSDRAGAPHVTADDYVTILHRHHLDGVTGRINGDDARQTDPAQGSVVPVGSTVTLGTPTHAERVTTQDVGTHGVQVTIPASWQQVPQPICGAAAVNSYSLDTVSSAEYRCPESRPATNDSLHLAVGAARSYGLRGDPDRRVETLDGLRIVTAGAQCGRGRCQQVWSLSQQRLTVVAQVSASRRRLLSQIGSSIRPVPVGYTTVPDVSTQDVDQARSLIEAAGLAYAYDGLLGTGILLVSPAPGAVVPLGSTVHVSAG